MRRWLRFVFAGDNGKSGNAVAVEGEDTHPQESPDGLISAAELPSASDTLEDLFSDQPTAADTGEDTQLAESAFRISAWAPTDSIFMPEHNDMLEPIPSPDLPSPTASDSLASNEPAEVWEPAIGKFQYIPEDESPSISATELASATHTLAEMFPAEQLPNETALESDHSDDDEVIASLFSAMEARTLEAEATEDTEDLTGARDLIALSTEDESANAVTVAPAISIIAEPEMIVGEESPVTPSESPLPPRVPSSDWALEEKLASHREWIESQGASGKKADFSSAKLEGIELIGVNLRLADFHDADLLSADFLLTDLRDACMVRANLDEACLVGANLEGANLEGANLETTLGLVARQIAGANLRDAHLPPQIIEFPASVEFERTSKMVSRYFVALMAASVVSWLIIWKTNDAQLLMNLSVIPFLHSRAAAAALPAKESYLIMPVALFIVYLVFQFHVQRLWHSVLELPAVFPDGSALGEREPAIVTSLLRAHFRWMNDDVSSTQLIEKGLSIFLAYWIIPLTLLFFWVRYLTLQEFHGTFLQALLAMGATGVAVHATTKTGRPQETWALKSNPWQRFLHKMWSIKPTTAAIVAVVILLFLSAGTIAGVPHDRSQAPQYGAANIRRWAPSLLWWASIDPYADLTEAAISTPPADWTGADDQLSSVNGRKLNNAKFRYAQGHGAFLVNAHLWRADFEGAFLSQADLRGADLGQSNMRFSILDEARMSHANLDRANLDRAHLSRTDLRDANLSYASLVGADLVDAQLGGASFYTARLPSATLTRAHLEKADFRDAHLENAQLENADFRGAYLWSANLSGANLLSAQFANAILIDADLQRANLRGAQLSGAVMNGTKMSGANLDGADLRGAPGLTANQVCSAKSRMGALLDYTLEKLVEEQCSTAH